MPRSTDAALAAALRPVAEALISPDDIRREREHDATHERGGRLRGDRVRGRLPQNTTGVIAAGSVQVPASGISPAENLGDHLADVETEVAGKLDNPLTAPGGIVVAGPDGAPLEVPAGNEGDVLVMVAGAPVWTPGADIIGGGSWSVLTNGDPADPQLVFALGDVVMVEGG